MRIRSVLSSALRTMLPVCLLLLCFAPTASAQGDQWVRPTKPGDALVWGRKDGVVFGLASEGGMRGPRGLIRVGFYTPDLSGPQLLNFIAVEPVTKGVGERFSRMGFSEMEMSELDPGQQGKRMTVHGDNRGVFETLHVGKATVERLSVRIDVERFTANGAHVYVIASVDSDHPKEIRLTPVAEPDSAPVEELSLSATMGNFERLRLLWLKNQVIRSGDLFGKYSGNAFTEAESYPLPDLLRTGDGDAIVFCTSDETNPRYSTGNNTAHWIYNLPKMTQYWLVPGADVEPNLRARVNARRVYWRSEIPLPGGIAFENFEVRQRYVSGQTFVFGITEKEPWQFYTGLSHLTAPAQPNPVSNEAPRP